MSTTTLHAFECNNHMTGNVHILLLKVFYNYIFKRSTFVGSAWSFGFFIPATTVNDLRLWRIFYPRCYPLHLFSYLNSWERASISLFNVQCYTRELLVSFSKRLWYDTVLDWGLNPWPPALEASTLPLGYRGGGPWLGIEPVTSRIRSPYSTTRLSRRRYSHVIKWYMPTCSCSLRGPRSLASLCWCSALSCSKCACTPNACCLCNPYKKHKWWKYIMPITIQT